MSSKTKVVSLPTTKPFKSNMMTILKILVQEGYQIDLVFPNDSAGMPVTKGGKYKLRIAGDCGLVFDHDNDDHIHVRGKRIADGFESIGAEIVCTQEVVALIDSWLMEEPKRLLNEMQTLFEKFVANKKFKPGDKVAKFGINNYQYPLKDSYAIFIGYLDEKKGENGDEDCEIMIRDREGDVVVVYHDSRHLDYWVEQTTTENGTDTPPCNAGNWG